MVTVPVAVLSAFSSQDPSGMFEPFAIRSRFQRKQEASVPPKGLPQFSC